MFPSTRIGRAVAAKAAGVSAGLVACLALYACAPAPTAPEASSRDAPPARVVAGRAAEPTGVAPSNATADARAADIYEVVPARSEIRVLVYRAGPLARLGHSHVLVARDVRGEVRLPADARDVAFTLAWPVASFAVDEPEARAAEGAEFASRPTEADVAGTRRNLLGPQVLDAERYGEIRLVGAGASGGPDEWRVRATVELRGRATTVEAPVKVERAGDTLFARGELRLAQSALGMMPFSVAMGALQVADEMTVRYVVVAAMRRD